MFELLTGRKALGKDRKSLYDVVRTNGGGWIQTPLCSVMQWGKIEQWMGFDSSMSIVMRMGMCGTSIP